MSNWNNDYKIDTWDPSSIRTSNNGTRQSPSQSSQYNNGYQSPPVRNNQNNNFGYNNTNESSRQIGVSTRGQSMYSDNQTSSPAANLVQEQMRQQQLLQQKEQLLQQQLQKQQIQQFQQQRQQQLQLQKQQQQRQQDQHQHQVTSQKSLYPQNLRTPNYPKSPQNSTFQPNNMSFSGSNAYTPEKSSVLSPSGSNYSSPKPSFNNASTPASATSPYNSYNTPTHAPMPSYGQPQSADKAIFFNPLIDSTEDFQTTSEEEIKIQNMIAASQKDQQNASRRPNSIAKASLAQISHDLQKAGEPFQSATALKNFKKMSLGLLPSSEYDTPIVKNDFTLSLSTMPVKESMLSVNAKAFTPRTPKPTPPPPPTELPTEILQQAIDHFGNHPGKYRSEGPQLLKTLELYNLNEENIQEFASMLFEASLAETSFAYIGSKLCDSFARSNKFDGFRGAILSLAQKEFLSMDNVLAGGDSPEVKRVRNFVAFMSELYLNMKTADYQRFMFLGDKVVDSVEKLIVISSSANIVCVTKILNICMNKLVDQFESQSYQSSDKLKEYSTRLNALINKICSLKEDNSGLSECAEEALDKFIKLKRHDWGRSSAEIGTTDSSDPNPLGGWCYFSPEGKMYTEADLMEREYKDKMDKDGKNVSVSENTSSLEDTSGLDFSNLSLEPPNESFTESFSEFVEPDVGSKGSQDDYDEDYDHFLETLS